MTDRPAGSDAAPPPERFGHGRVTRAERQVADAQGSIGRPYLAEGLLGMLHRRGQIDHQQRAAGDQFARLFRLAALDPLRAADMGQRIGGNATQSPAFIEYARRRINAALDACGGIGSPAGSCAWYILGLDMPLAEWARREGWSGRPLNPHVAKGTLLATLGVLVAHFRAGPQNVG